MTGGVRRIFLDDAWILEHWTGSEVAALCREYNAAHGTDLDKGGFNFYIKRWLGLSSRGRKFEQQEKEWLKANYPTLGSKRTAEEFLRRFGREISPKTLKSYCRRCLGCSVSKEVKYQDRTAEVGTISKNCRNEVKVKTEDGWKKAKHLAVDVPKGMIAFNLDKDIYNNSPENIGITTNSVFRSLRNYGFWSDQREITKAGLLCCELEKLTKKGGA